MTLDTNCMKFLTYFFGQTSFYPKEDGTYHKNISEKCTILVEDILIYLRSMQRQSQMNEDGERNINKCGDIIKMLFYFAKSVLSNDETQINTIVLRFDLLGRTPKAKYSIYKKRYEKVPDYKMEDVTVSPFTDETPLPAEMNSIFKNHIAKKFFYEYITESFKKNFKNIPRGKRIIIDGSIEVDPETNKYIICNPLIIEATEDNDTSISYMEDKWKTTEGESDIGMFEWINNINQPSILVSEDGDVILIALLRHSRNLLPDGPLFIRKRKVQKTIPLEGERLRCALEKKKTNPRTRTTRTEYESLYIDVKALHKQIVGIEEWYGGKSKCKYPVETLCALFFMTGNDYVDADTLPNIGWKSILNTFIDNVDDIGNMIQFNEDECEYRVIRKLFEKYIMKLLLSRFSKCKKHGEIKSLKQLLEIYPTYYPVPDAFKQNGKPTRHHVLPTIGRIRGYAANIAYCLSYFANSEKTGVSKKCMDEDSEGFSVYGYTLRDKSKPSFSDNVVFSENVKKLDYYSCK